MARRRLKLPLIECAHEARPGEEMTPERVAEMLIEEEAGVHRDRRLDMFDRITFDPKIMAGRACIRGMRIMVDLVVNLVANGMRVEDIIGEYPVLEPEDIRQALQYASALANEEVYPLRIAS